MKRASELLDRLTAMGVTVQCEGGDLKVRGPAGAMDAPLREELRALKPQLLELLSRGPAHRGAASRGAATTGEVDLDRVPLSFNQRRLWFLDRLEGGGTAFVMAAGFALDGPLQLPALEQALAALLQRHELLRSVIVDEGAEPVLQVRPAAPVPLRAEAVDDPSDQAVAALLAQEARRPFDLTAAPPLRLRLFALQPQRHVLSLCLHHIAGDFWSMGLLLDELGRLYGAACQGRPAPLPALAMRYPDYAVWQRSALDEARLAPQLAFWQAQLQGAPTQLALPLDRARPAERGASGAHHRFGIDAAQSRALHAAAVRAGVTPFMALLAAYAAVLARWTGQDEVVIGCPVAHRDQPQTQGLVGFFIDTLPLRIDLRDDPSPELLLQRVRRTCLQAFEHQDVPFERIVQAVRPERALNRAPLFQTMFVQQTAGPAVLALDGLGVRPLPVPAGAPELDLNLSASFDGEAFACDMEYDADLFDPATVAALCTQFAHVAGAWAEDLPLSRLALAPQERTPAPAPVPAAQPLPGVPRLIARAAQRWPQRMALQAFGPSGAQSLTYLELMQHSAALAQRLRASGARPGGLVGLGLGHGLALPVAMLAAWRCGCAYTVLGLARPLAQRASMMAAAGVAIVVAEPGAQASWPPGTVLVAPLTAPEPGQDFTEEPPEDLAQRAYVCFTSGSTGTPKGVAISHANLAHHAAAIGREFALGEDDRVLQFAAPDFDVAAEEIFPTLAAGACVVLRPEGAIDSLDGFQSWVDQTRLSVLNLPSAFWHEWVGMLQATAEAPPSCLRLVVTGSDRVFARALRQWQALCRHPVALRSGYGPTEATISTSFFDPARDALPEACEILPLGQALADVRIAVVDAAGQAVPVGAIGEIVIGGAGVAQGYLGLDEATQAAFRACPALAGARAYWSGDLARRRADGALEFLGRRDAQMKIRGFRIEPAEVEAALVAHPGVGEAAVVLAHDGAGQPLLLAVAAGQADAAALRGWLAERLPPYMVPAVCRVLPALPRTASGKIDRRALAALAESGPLDGGAAEAVPPSGPLESLLAELFAQVLGLPRVGVTDNVFDLGVDSIRCLQIVSRARRQGLGLAVRDIFRSQTVRALAGELALRAPAAPSAGTAQDDGGALAPTPIQAWFLEHAGPQAAHYNQAAVLRLPPGLAPEAVRRALAGVQAQHAMLRLRVDAQGGLDVADAVPGPLLEVVALAGLAPAEAAQRREQAFAAAQRGLDPAAGRMLRAVLLDGQDRLMLAIHHLAVDAYSWTIVLEDLALACAQAARGQALQLPPPTSAYAHWSRRLGELAAAPEAAAQAQALVRRFAGPGASVLPAALRPGRVGEAQTLSFALDAATTAALLHDLPRALSARVDEALLAALVLGGARLGVQGPWVLDLERNGRADLFEDLDLSRTVGWFTALQRVGIDADSGNGPQDAAALVAQVAAQVRAAPWQGLAQGLLRYRSPDSAVRQALAALPEPQVLLNYLGPMDIAPACGEALAVVDEAAGAAQDPGLARSHVIELNAGLWEGCLRAELSFPAGDDCRRRVVLWLEQVQAVLAEIAVAARAQAALPSPVPPLSPARPAPCAPAAAEQELALTPLQQGLLYHSLRAPDDPVYFDQLTLALDGPLQPALLRQAWEAVVARHGVLRTSFHWDQGTPVQRVHARAELPWREDDWRQMAPEAQPPALAALLQADRERGFDLGQAPLMRLHLLRTGPQRHELVWSAHHLLLDGWSVSVVMDEVFRLYGQALGDGTPALAPAPDFADCVRWHQRRDAARDQAFWRQALQGLAQPTALDFLRQAGEPVEPGAPDPIECVLAPQRAAAVAALARQARTTPGTVLQAAWALLLSRHSGSRDLVFGVTVSGRAPELPGVEQMVGMLIATVPARVRLACDRALVDWLAQLQHDHLEREQHAAASLAEIRQASELAAGAELFQSLVLVQNYPAPDALQAGGLRLAGVVSHERTNFLLTLACMQGEGGLRLALHRDREQVPAAAARRLLEQLQALLDAMAAAPQQTLGRLLELPPEPARAALEAGTGAAEPMQERWLTDWIDHWARETPAALALDGPGGPIDYAALARLSRTAAAALQSLGVAAETRVALCVNRSVMALAALAGILRAGAAFVPIDPALPAQRQRFMLQDSGAALVLADAGLALADELGLRCLTLEQLFGAEASAGEGAARPQAQSAAYVIYTSGSTGTPKGVVNTRAGMRALAHAQQRVFGLGGGDRVLQFASLSFDASVWEMCMAWRHGAALCVPPADMARAGPQLQAFLRRQGISAATLPPTVLASLEAPPLDALRLLVVAGEACPPELALRWSAGRRFFNAYGPTEASVAVSVEEGVHRPDQLPIGRPLPNMQLHVLDEDMRLLPPGTPGELYIGGAGLARGYLGRADLTDASFVPDPFGAPGERLYRTGDRGWRLADGRVQFAGRRDHQVKLRGLRIELGEIEAALATHPGVQAACALVRSHGEADHRLAACVEVAAPVGAEALRAHLAQRLPAHMVPAYFIELERLPLTHSGKIDRQALGRLDPPAPSPAAPAAPAMAGTPSAAGDAAARLAAIWAQVLGVAEVGPQHSFFELGGDSILAIQVVARANREGLGITLQQLMDPATQTVACLVSLLPGGGAPLQAPDLAPVDVDGGGEVPLTPIQHWFLAQPAPERQHYNQSFLLTVPRGLAPQRLQAALALLQQRHDALRLRFHQRDGAWVQTLAPASAPVLEVVASPPGDTPAAWRARLQAAAVANQTRLDLADGPLMRAVLYPAPEGQAEARLHLVVHHLAIDAVSWRVLLDELAEACAQGAIARAPAVPFTRWAAALARHAASPAARAELPYWLGQGADARLPLARGAGAPSAVGDALTHSVQLAQAETTALLREAPRVHGAALQELLLAALATALAPGVTGARIGVALESHGRDVVLDGLEVGASVGWFTALAPLALPLPVPVPGAPASAQPAGLAAVREALRAMPRRGFGYGVLRQLSPEPAVRQALADLAAPDIAFNYLGQWDTAWPEGQGPRPAPEPDGPGFAATTPRAFALEVNAMVTGGRLVLDLSYDPRDLDAAWVAALADGMQAWLAAVAAGLRDAGPPAAMPSAAPPPTHGLAPQQHAMLAHALACPGSTAYVVQLAASLPPALDVPAFMAAWNGAVARHAALRACFAAGASGPGQRVDEQAPPAPWRREDWSAWPLDQAQAAFGVLREIEQARGFDLACAPLMRFALARMPDGSWRFCWTYHHLLVDGWSMPILLADVQAAYAGQAPQAAAPDVRGFLDWLGRQDTGAAQAFWAAQLAGLQPSRWPAPEAAQASGRSRQVQRVLAAGAGARVAAFARRHRLSVPSVALLAWALVLARHTGRDDLAFGVTSALRPAEVEGAEAMVGALLATPPLRVALDRSQGFAAACQQLQRRRVQAAGHAWLAPSAIAQAAGLASADDLFGTAVRIQNYPAGDMGRDSAALALQDVDLRDAWHHPFNLEVMPGEGFSLVAVHDALTVAPALADGLLQAMACLLEALDEDRPLAHWIGQAGEELNEERNEACNEERHG